MDRRAFLRALGFGTVAAAAAATSIYDLERLLWVPGEQTIFLAPIGSWVPTHISWIGDGSQHRILFHKDAFSFVMAELPLPTWIDGWTGETWTHPSGGVVRVRA